MAATTTPSANHLSSFLHELSPNKYGGQQEDYLARSEKTIDEAVQTMKTAAASAASLSELFFIIQRGFNRKRHQIAIDHDTKNASYFGKLRISKDLPEGANYTSPVTPLGGPYTKYNEIVLEQLHQILSPLRRTLSRLMETRIETSESVLGGEVSFSAILLTETALRKIKIAEPPSNEKVQSILNTDKDLEAIKKDYALMKKFKRQAPPYYERSLMPWVFNRLVHQFPSPKIYSDGSCVGNLDYLKNIYVLGELCMVIDKKLYRLSRYLTWLYQDFENDPIDRMTKSSVVTIIHQDPFLIKKTLKAISKMFENILLWNAHKHTLQELKHRVALFRFTFAHCMPCARGDGAIGDWFEHAFYRFHGFVHTRHHSDNLPCFEPLASLSLSHYLVRYEKTIIVA